MDVIILIVELSKLWDAEQLWTSYTNEENSVQFTQNQLKSFSLFFMGLTEYRLKGLYLKMKKKIPYDGPTWRA